MAMFRRADVPIVQFYCPEHGPMSVLAEQASVADSTGYSALVACKGHVLEVELDLKEAHSWLRRRPWGSRVPCVAEGERSVAEVVVLSHL